MRWTKYAEIIKKIPSPIYKCLAQAWYDKRYPRHLFIELTRSCNLHCPYCPRQRAEESPHMDFRLFKQLIQEAKMYGPRSFSLHLFGEPLLYPSILEAISYIKQANKSNTVILTTNGTRLDDFSEHLIRSGVDKIIISEKKETNISEKTRKELKKWRKVEVRELEGSGEGENKSLRNLPRKKRELHNYGGSLKSLSTSSKGKNRWPCYHLWFAPAVAYNGDFLICCADPKHQSRIGNVRMWSISQMWKSPRMEYLRKAHREGKYDSICRNCDTWKYYPSFF